MDKLFDLEKLSAIFAEYAPKVLGAVITLLIGFMIIRWLVKGLRAYLNKRDVDPSLSPFLLSLLSILLKVMLLLSVAGMFGIETTSFIAIISALAFAVGMAMQGSLGHFASGVMILFFKPFKVGDTIKTQSYIGNVKEIRMFTTKLTTLDERVVIIPNSLITDNPIENFTASPIRKLVMTFGIGYSDDIDKARSILARVVQECPYTLSDKPVDIKIEALADSSVNFTVRPWIKTEDFWEAKFWVQEHVKKAFDKEGVGIPFPQMDLHVIKMPDASKN